MYFAFIHYIFFYYKILELITDSLYETWFSPAKMIFDSIHIIYVLIIINILFFTIAIKPIARGTRIKPKIIFACANLFFYFIQLVNLYSLFIVNGRCMTSHFKFWSIFGKCSINQWPIRFGWYAFYRLSVTLLKWSCYLISNVLVQDWLVMLFQFGRFVSLFSIHIAFVNMQLFCLLFLFCFTLNHLPIILRLGFMKAYMECWGWSHYLINMWHLKHPAASRYELASVAYKFEH